MMNSWLGSWFVPVEFRHPRSSISQGCASASAGSHHVLTLLSKAYWASRPGRALLTAHVYRSMDTGMEALSFPNDALALTPGAHCGVSDGPLMNIFPLASKPIGSMPMRRSKVLQFRYSSVYKAHRLPSGASITQWCPVPLISPL